MKVAVLTNTGVTFKGEPKEVVLQMTRADFITGGKGEYMQQVRERIKTIYEIDLEFEEGDFLGFLKALEKAEFLEMDIH